MSMRFESHITIRKPQSIVSARKLFTIAESNGMTTSWITGDPILGAGKYFYMNGFGTDYEVLLAKVKEVSQGLRFWGYDVVREKIEQIMYDTKTGFVECGVECVACLDK